MKKLIKFYCKLFYKPKSTHHRFWKINIKSSYYPEGRYNFNDISNNLYKQLKQL